MCLWWGFEDKNVTTAAPARERRLVNRQCHGFISRMEAGPPFLTRWEQLLDKTEVMFLNDFHSHTLLFLPCKRVDFRQAVPWQ